MGAHQQIKYPLNHINDLIQKDITNCNNTRKPNHSKIEIIYEMTDDGEFTVYRCPVCLCIPFVVNYEYRKIEYKCNCGIHNCSIDYFLLILNLILYLNLFLKIIHKIMIKWYIVHLVLNLLMML